jgi:hypothetical protein
MKVLLEKYLYQDISLKLIFLAIAIAYIIKSLKLFAPDLHLVLYSTYDDSYYYFQIARNIISGAGVSFDGLAPTNGFHPLWLLILVPIWFFFGGGSPIFPVRIALGVNLLFDIGVTFLLYKVLVKIVGRRLIAGSLVLLWVFNPFAYFTIMSGMETGVVLFFFLLFIYLFVGMPEENGPREYVVLGVVAGLMMLARTDYFFMAGAPFIILFFSKNWRYDARLLGYYLLAATIVVLPWLLWNLKNFGTIIQTSGTAFSAVQYHLVEFANRSLHPIPRFLKASFGNLADGLPEVFKKTGSAAAYFIGLSAVWGFVLAKRSVIKERTFQTLLALTFCVIVFVLFQVGVRWAVRDWYFFSLNIIMILWLGYGLKMARSSLSEIQWQKIKGPFGVAVFVFLIFIGLNFTWSWWRNYRETSGSHSAFLAGAEWIRENIPEGESVGVLNAGIIGYLSERRVINLDGLVNNAAGEAIKEKRLYQYAIQDAGLNYLVDFDRAITFKFVETWGVDIRKHIELINVIYEGSTQDSVLKMSAYRFRR